MVVQVGALKACLFDVHQLTCSASPSLRPRRPSVISPSLLNHLQIQEGKGKSKSKPLQHATNATSLKHEVQKAAHDIVTLKKHLDYFNVRAAEIRNVLRRLEVDKEMFSSLIPAIRYLPAEVLLRIFSFVCVEGSEIKAQPKLAHLPLAILGRVCYSWRQLVLSSQALWTSISLDLRPCLEPIPHPHYGYSLVPRKATIPDLGRAVRYVLSKSGRMPLSVVIRSPGQVQGIASPARLLLNEMERWKDADLYISQHYLEDSVFRNPTKSPLPHLCRLLLHVSGKYSGMKEDINAFAHCPRLTELDFGDVDENLQTELFILPWE